VLTLLPIILGQTFYQISAMIDDIMYGNIMASLGVSQAIISHSSGNYTSSFMILISLPMGVASAMSASMLPSIVASRAKHLYSEITSKIHATVKANMLVAIPSAVGLIVLGKSIVQLLFPSYNITEGSALQGIDKMNIPVINSCISLIVHIILVWSLLKFTNLGIYAIVIGSETFPIIIMILNLVALYKHIDYKQELLTTFGIPFLCSIIMGIVSGIVYKLMMLLCDINLVSLLFAGVAAAAGYFLPIILFKKKGIY